MKNPALLLLLIGDIFFIAFLLIKLFYKYYLHYKLIQALTLNKDKQSKFSLLDNNIKRVLWFFLPMYFPVKSIDTKFDTTQLYNRKLVKNNYWVIAILLFYFLWLFISHYIVSASWDVVSKYDTYTWSITWNDIKSYFSY